MKALTIHQPWADLIAHGVKFEETRSWSPGVTALHQPLAIHASKKRITIKQWNKLPEEVRDGFRKAKCKRNNLWGPPEALEDVIYGSVVAIARLNSILDIKEQAGPNHVLGMLISLEKMRDRDGDIPCVRPNMKFETNELGDFAPGRHAWLFDKITRIKPIPARGYQGLWNWDEKKHEVQIVGREFSCWREER